MIASTYMYLFQELHVFMQLEIKLMQFNLKSLYGVSIIAHFSVWIKIWVLYNLLYLYLS